MTIKKLYIAILILLGILISGCSSGDDSFGIQPTQPVSKDQIVTTTTMVSFNRAGSTRALTPEGVKTFAVGDQMAVMYTNTSDATVKVVSAALTANDISADSKSANFKVTMTNPKANGAVTYIYPAAMANADGTPNLSALDTQNGTLATLASDLDYAQFTGTLTAGAKLPETAWLDNQLTLCKFDIKSGDDTNINNTITKLTITNGGNTYTVNCAGAANPIYVAMQPVTSGDISFEAVANGNCRYERTISGETLAASYLYNISMPMLMKQTFNFTGTAQTITIPTTGWYTIEAYGAEGGASTQNLDGSGNPKYGGKGGYSSITYNLSQGQTLYIYCGRKGGDASCPTGGAGGWNGGGNGGNGYTSTAIGGGGGGGATYVSKSDYGVISGSNLWTDGSQAASPTAKSDLILVAGGGGGGGYNGCVAGAGGGDSWTVGKRASDGDADVNYKNGTNVTFTGSQGGTGKTGTDAGNQRGGSGGHGGGFKAVATLSGQQQTYAGCGGSGWGETTNGKFYTTTSGGATEGGDGKVIITWMGTPLQGVNNYTLQIDQSW